MSEPHRLLVTGANGYIGAHVVAAAADLGLDVIAAGLGDASCIDARARFEEFDLFGHASDPDLFERFGRPQACIHLAYRDGFRHNAPSHLGDLPAHKALIENLAAAGCERIAAMGTMHEVGYHVGAIEADTPCRPQSLYGIGKNALRQALLEVVQPQVKGQIRWLRAYYIFGDDARGNSIFAKMVAAAAEGKTHFPFTSGKNRYDFIHVDDLATQIVCAALSDSAPAVVNCCTGRPVSLKDQALWFIRERGLGLELDYGAFPDRPYDSPETYGDPADIRAVLRQALAGDLLPAGRARVERALANVAPEPAATH